MGLTPTTPQLKSFWERPEGKTGMVSIIVGSAVALYGAYWLMPFLITLLTDTLHMIYLAAAVAASIFVLTNGTFLTLVKFGFKSVMRFLTGIFIEIDPIGILRNFVAEMKKQRQMLQDQISKVSGAVQQLKDNITKNDKDITKSVGVAAEAERQQNTATDPQIKFVMSTKIAENMGKATRLKTTNSDLKILLTNLQRIYDLLIRWDAATQFYINDRENQVNEYAIKRKAVNAAYSAMSSAKRILRGNADDNALYDQTLEYLSEDASMKLGEMADFARISADFMTNIDLENGAANHDALKQLETMSQKLLPAGATYPGFIDAAPVDEAQLQPVAVRRTAAAQGYEDLIK